MEVIQKGGPEVFESFGSIGEGLFESIAPEIDMTDDLAFVWLKGRFAFDVEGCGRGGRIGFALADGVPEELEDIIVLQPCQTAGGIPGLTEGAEIEAGAADNCQGPYQNNPHQALVGQ